MDHVKEGAGALMVALLLGVVTASSVVAQPANDGIADATEVTGIPFSDTIDTSAATSDPTDPTDCSSPTPSSVWYVFTPSTDISIEVSTVGSSYFASVSVFVGSPGSLAPIICGFQELTLDAAGGTTYYFMVGDVSASGGGNLRFNVAELAKIVELTVDPTGSFDSHTGTATVHGTVTCNRDGLAYFASDMLRQKVGRRFITGSFLPLYVPIDCPSSGGPWTATATGDGLFKGGTATLTGFAYACGDFFCGFGVPVGPVTVKLKGK